MGDTKNTNTETQETQVDQQSAGTKNTSETQGQPKKEAKSYTEEEVNARIQQAVQDRVSRITKKFEGFDEIKAELEELRNFKKEAEEANMTEAEKMKTRLEELTNESQGYKSKYEELESKYKQERLQTAFKEEARKQGISYVEDALRLADLSVVDVDDEGKFVGLEDVVKGLAESKPFLLEKKEQPKPIGGPSNPETAGVEKTHEQRLAEAAETYRKSGRTEDMVAYIRLKNQN